MVGADHKGHNIFFIQYLNLIFLQIILFIYFISFVEFYIFRFLFFPLVIVGIDHSKDMCHVPL
jgi:hypothetical protein